MLEIGHLCERLVVLYQKYSLELEASVGLRGLWSDVIPPHSPKSSDGKLCETLSTFT